jgi:Kef-type K+ transport system membrane component KefB
MQQFLSRLAEVLRLPLENPVPVFGIFLLVILIAPLLFRRFNIPGIVGLILMGVVIGPHGLNLVIRNSAVDLFSTIGLLYLMFMAGLELDLVEFKTNRFRSLTFGILTFAIPLSLGFPVCYYLLGYSPQASLLTASMFSTHTLIAYPIVSRLGIATSQVVALTVGGTILTDTGVLILLAVVAGSGGENLDWGYWVTLVGCLLVFSICMFWLVPRIAKWFFRKLEGEKHSHYILVLLVVFLAAFLARLAGVEPIIGAFVAGLALNPLIPRSSVLMNRIEFIGNALFIPFFLISVGMLVDISVISRGPGALLVAATLTLLALSSKWLAALATQRIYGYSVVQGQLIFGLSSAHAAATLAVILVGYEARILDETILNGTILLILTTCLVSTLVTEKSARKIALATPTEKETKGATALNKDHILLPVASTTSFEKLLDFCLLIKERKSDGPIYVLTVVPNDEEAEANIMEAKKRLQGFAHNASGAEVEVDFIAAISHNVASGIALTSREVTADLVVLGWPAPTGILDRLFGEKMESIVHGVAKPLFICEFLQPLETHERIVIISPPFTELEPGFEQWLFKVAHLCQALSLTVIFYCQPTTEEVVQDKLRQRKVRIDMNFVSFDAWENYPSLAQGLRKGDLLVFVAARRDSVSHRVFLENPFPSLDAHFGYLSRVVVYPSANKHADEIRYLGEVTL